MPHTCPTTAPARWKHDHRGASAVEYALLAALIAGVIVAVVVTFGQDVLSLFGIAGDPHW